MSSQIIRGNALNLPLADDSVDLVVTSPPYLNLRAYQDGGQTYEGQIGNEPTHVEFIDSLIAATREMIRVLKSTGSLWINLGDSYRDKSLVGTPWRYALRCIDDLGLILRAEVIWSKPNGLPESVTDRVRRSHEQWFHFTLNPRYYSAVDEVREAHVEPQRAGVLTWEQRRDREDKAARYSDQNGHGGTAGMSQSPLGKLPGSVWTIPTEPLRVPDHLGVDHFAAFPTEWPRRIITGWSPRGVCVECGAGRRPVVERERFPLQAIHNGHTTAVPNAPDGRSSVPHGSATTVTGEACDCPEPTAPTTPGVVLDPFGGTGTTALVADALGRHGISVDMSRDYCRLATWRTSDPKQRAKAARKPFTPAAEQVDGQLAIFEEMGA